MVSEVGDVWTTQEPDVYGVEDTYNGRGLGGVGTGGARSGHDPTEVVTDHVWSGRGPTGKDGCSHSHRLGVVARNWLDPGLVVADGVRLDPTGDLPEGGEGDLTRSEEVSEKREVVS